MELEQSCKDCGKDIRNDVFLFEANNRTRTELLCMKCYYKKREDNKNG
ncbi:hypothetical protein HYT57_02025 [Candidatus Woesearchaeota archaeon]|nr:hypothetical protein [Candidatus Woesearchaeota archaeon]